MFNRAVAPPRAAGAHALAARRPCGTRGLPSSLPSPNPHPYAPWSKHSLRRENTHIVGCINAHALGNFPLYSRQVPRRSEFPDPLAVREVQRRLFHRGELHVAARGVVAPLPLGSAAMFAGRSMIRRPPTTAGLRAAARPAGASGHTSGRPGVWGQRALRRCYCGHLQPVPVGECAADSGLRGAAVGIAAQMASAPPCARQPDPPCSGLRVQSRRRLRPLWGISARARGAGSSSWAGSLLLLAKFNQRCFPAPRRLARGPGRRDRHAGRAKTSEYRSCRAVPGRSRRTGRVAGASRPPGRYRPFAQRHMTGGRIAALASRPSLFSPRQGPLPAARGIAARPLRATARSCSPRGCRPSLGRLLPRRRPNAQICSCYSPACFAVNSQLCRLQLCSQNRRRRGPQRSTQVPPQPWRLLDMAASPPRRQPAHPRRIPPQSCHPTAANASPTAAPDRAAAPRSGPSR